jgi:hypothetical protein
LKVQQVKRIAAARADDRQTLERALLDGRAEIS